MSPIGLLARGLLARRGLTALILVVAVIAVAAAATGPAYQVAARHSILADDLHAAPPVGTIVDVDGRGALGVLPQLASSVDHALQGLPARDLFQTPVRGQELSIVPGTGETGVLAWRDDLCAHLRWVQGRCPAAAGEVVVSEALAAANHLYPGQDLSLLGTSRIVGVYQPLDPKGRYWAARGYFPQQAGSGARLGSQPVDAIFTDPASFTRAASLQGDSVVDLLLDLDATTPDRVGDVRTTVNGLSTAAVAFGAFANTSLPTVLDEAEASTATLSIPVTVITAQLLVLVWLLLFLAVTDAAEARGADVALARLRGLAPTRTLAFGLGETLLLLLLALPGGLLVGWAAMVSLAHLALRTGTPVVIGWSSVVAAVVAVSGGMVAAVLGARRTLRRSVLEQWRRPGLSVRRGWVLDVAILVATVAALAELYVRGTIGVGQTDPLALLVPGLLGLAVAVVLSRLLPWGCRALFGLTRRRGGIGAFLAVRQLVRRPAGMRTFVVLSAALSLATFAISAWVVNRANISDVAATRTGAAEVLTVQAPPDQDIGAIVTRLDPGGSHAMAVTDFVDTSNAARQTLAVQSDRLARIAFWRTDFSATPLAELAARLHPPTSPSIRLTGETLRVSLADVQLSRPQLLTANLKLPTGVAETPLSIGVVTPDTKTLTVALPACPCVLRSLTLSDTGAGIAANQAQGTAGFQGALTVTAIDEPHGSAWRPVPGTDLTSGDRWSWSGAGLGSPTGAAGAAQPTAGGLRLSFDVPPLGTIEWSAPSWPTPMPALATPSVAALPRNPTISVAGLDGAPLPITPVAVVPVPGAPDNGVIIDRANALQAAFDARFASVDQVWLAPDAMTSFPPKLRDAGVQIVSSSSAAEADRMLRQQGPALALSLFLADAAAAALLAAAGALTGLYLSGRRRRQELAALLAEGARRGELRSSLLLEQGLTLGLGVLSGIGSGLLAVWLALRAVPQFVTSPSAPTLHYSPDPVLLGTPLAAIAVLVLVTAVAGTLALVATTRTELLRQEAT
jgi:hypothetical protein